MMNIEPGFSIAQDLPFDILHEIFQLCLPSTENPQSDQQPNVSLAPLLLCHICVSWRIAALGMSSIWKSTTFLLHTTRRPDPPMDRLILPRTTRFIEWWNNYLGDVPPSLSIYWPSTATLGRRIPARGLPDIKTSLFDSSFFRSAHSLQLVIMNQELDIICSNSTPFPNLTEIRIESIQDSRMPRIDWSHFPPAPHLTRLHISHAESFEERTLNIFPWEQLTHLYLPRTISVPSWKKLIQRCENLKIAAVIVSGTDAERISESPIVVGSLRQLVAASNNMRTGVPFYGLVFPQLTAFRLISGWMASRMVSIEALEELLSAMPAIQELHFDSALSFSDGENIPFDQVRVQHGHSLSAYAPHLRHLVIDYIDPSNANVGQNMIKFLKSEWLCSGWESHNPAGRRKLEFIVSTSSYSDHEPIPDGIVAEVSAFLNNEWPSDAPFEISIREEELKKGVERGIFDVFDEKFPNRGWDKAVDFYTPP